MSVVSFDVSSAQDAHQAFSLGSPPGGVIPYIGTYFDSGSGFNVNYVGVLTSDPGQDPTALSTPTANAALTPVVSPDGSLIVWKQQGALRVIAPDGSGETQIKSSAGGALYAPNWHPDGSKILYVCNTNGTGTDDEIRTILPDGTGEAVLYTDPSNRAIGGAGYNYDGSKIAFTVLLSSSSIGLWVMNADGTGATQIATMPTQFSAIRKDDPPVAWFKTASRLVHKGGTLSSPTWIACDDDGTNAVTLDSGTTRRAPTWRAMLPDDSAYVCSTSNSNSIALVAADGSGATILVNVATPGTVQTENVLRFFGRYYFDAGDDIRSVLVDGTGERNESASTTHNLGLTG